MVQAMGDHLVVGSGGAGAPVDWAVVGAAVCRVSMAKEDRIRAGVCLRTRTQTGQARAPRALWSAPYRL